MKKEIIILLLAIIFCIPFTGCTEDFEEINRNKHEFNEIDPEYQMSSAIKSSINWLAYMNSKLYWSYSHQITIGGDEANYGSSLTDVNTIWKNFYSTIYMLKSIERDHKNKEGYENRILISQIWQSYLFFIHATTFGAIPYTHATDPTTTVVPYDKETDVYADILAILKNACEKLDASKDKLIPDIVFGTGDKEEGNIERWRSFAYCLRLKIALEIQNVLPDLAQEHATDVMAHETELLSSNNDNMFVQWGGSNSTEYSWYYEKYVYDQTTSDNSRPYFSHLMFVYMRSYPDPRMKKYAQPTEVPFYIQDTLYDATYTMKAVVRYQIPYNGRPKTTQMAGLDDNEGSDTDNNPMKSLASTQFSKISNDFLNADGKQIFMWYSDVCFMKAEAAQKGYGGSKSAEQYYYEGIDASFAQYGLSQAQATAYKELEGVKWGTEKLDAHPDFRKLVYTNIANDPMQKIIVQRWLAGFFYGAHDAWCYIRRTRLIDLPPHLNPTKLSVGGQTIVANLPERLHYPNDEVKYNNSAYNAAVATLGGGGDITPTYLKIAQPYNRKSSDEWRVTPVYLNSEAWFKWYGYTINDVINAGADYQIISVIEE